MLVRACQLDNAFLYSRDCLSILVQAERNINNTLFFNTCFCCCLLYMMTQTRGFSTFGVSPDGRRVCLMQQDLTTGFYTISVLEGGEGGLDPHSTATMEQARPYFFFFFFCEAYLSWRTHICTPAVALCSIVTLMIALNKFVETEARLTRLKTAFTPGRLQPTRPRNLACRMIGQGNGVYALEEFCLDLWSGTSRAFLFCVFAANWIILFLRFFFVARFL